jgi:gliding motility-associated lipoprotein GldD
VKPALRPCQKRLPITDAYTKQQSMKNIMFIFAASMFWMACNSEESSYSPKPRTYPRIDFPAHGEANFEEGYCDFVFQYPSYAEVKQDTLFFGHKPLHPCWFDLYMPSLGARVHCTYYPINKNKKLQDLVGDAFELVNKHNVRADYIDEYPFANPSKEVYGMVFDFKGASATPFQFYLTDSTQHFLRGALYFNTQARPDSLAPVVDFVKKDVMQMLNTFEWK